MKRLGPALLVILFVLLGGVLGLYRRALASVQPVYDVLAKDERIAELRKEKFEICKTIEYVPTDKVTYIKDACGEYIKMK